MRNHITGRGALVRKLSGRARTVLGDGSKGDGCSQGRNIGGNRCTEKRRCYGDTAVGVGGVWGYEKKTASAPEEEPGKCVRATEIDGTRGAFTCRVSRISAASTEGLGGGALHRGAVGAWGK